MTLLFILPDPHQEQYSATIDEMMKRIKKGQVKLRPVNETPDRSKGSSKGTQAVQELDSILVSILTVCWCSRARAKPGAGVNSPLEQSNYRWG